MKSSQHIHFCRNINLENLLHYSSVDLFNKQGRTILLVLSLIGRLHINMNKRTFVTLSVRNPAKFVFFVICCILHKIILHMVKQHSVKM